MTVSMFEIHEPSGPSAFNYPCLTPATMVNNGGWDSPSGDGQTKPACQNQATSNDPKSTLNNNGATAGRAFSDVASGGWTVSQDGLHNGGSVYAFCDGHVKWLLGSQVSTGRTQSDARCNQDGVPAVTGVSCATTGAYAAGTQGTMNGVKPAATFGYY